MATKTKNSKGLNERKSNQGSMNIHSPSSPRKIKEEYFEVKDQETIEQKAGEQGQTSGESFDKNVTKNKQR